MRSSSDIRSEMTAEIELFVDYQCDLEGIERIDYSEPVVQEPNITGDPMSVPTRDPTSVTQTGGEAAGLGALGMIFAYYASKVDPDMPAAIEQAVVVLVIAAGSMILSRIRDKKHGAGS